MSTNIGTIIACPQIQEDLNTNFAQAEPLGAIVPQGLSEFIDSPTNTQGVLQRNVSTGGGKQRTVELLYTPPILEADVNTEAVKKCVSTNEAGQLSKEYSLAQDEGVEYNEVFSIAHMAAMCKDNSLWFAQRIQAIMDGLDAKIGTIVASQSALLTGAFGLGEEGVVADVKTIATRKADGSFNLDALEDISFAAMNGGYRGIPYIFGFGEIYKYFKRVAAGCCALDGIDVSAYAANNNGVFIADKKVQTALGDEGFLTLKPGALQLLTWLEYEGPFNTVNDGAYKQLTITSPKSGRTYDMTLKNDCGNISVSLKLALKVVGLPTDMYQAGSDFEGVTFVNEYAIVNP